MFRLSLASPFEKYKDWFNSFGNIDVHVSEKPQRQGIVHVQLGRGITVGALLIDNLVWFPYIKQLIFEKGAHIVDCAG